MGKICQEIHDGKIGGFFGKIIELNEIWDEFFDSLRELLLSDNFFTHESRQFS